MYILRKDKLNYKNGRSTTESFLTFVMYTLHIIATEYLILSLNEILTHNCELGFSD